MGDAKSLQVLVEQIQRFDFRRLAEELEPYRAIFDVVDALKDGSGYAIDLFREVDGLRRDKSALEAELAQLREREVASRKADAAALAERQVGKQQHEAQIAKAIEALNLRRQQVEEQTLTAEARLLEVQQRYASFLAQLGAK